MRLIWVLIFLVGCLYGVEIGEVPSQVALSGKDGGKVSGGAWDSSMLKDKVHVVFYVDPDEKDKNEAFADALKKEGFDHSKFTSVAIINLAATWKPDMIIEAILKSKQKKFPHAIYVKDKHKTLVKKWEMADDESDILIFDKSGKIIYKKFGKLSNNDISEAIKLIKKSMN